MEPTRKLYRSRAHRTIAGVCCGLADYFGVDPTLIRVIFVLLNLLGAPASCSTCCCGSSSPTNPKAQPDPSTGRAYSEVSRRRGRGRPSGSIATR
jgi:phage shock protein C